MRLTRKWPEGAAVAALRDIDAVSHKKHRSACRRINQCFLKINDMQDSVPIMEQISCVSASRKGSAALIAIINNTKKEEINEFGKQKR